MRKLKGEYEWYNKRLRRQQRTFDSVTPWRGFTIGTHIGVECRLPLPSGLPFHGLFSYLEMIPPSISFYSLVSLITVVDISLSILWSERGLGLGRIYQLQNRCESLAMSIHAT